MDNLHFLIHATEDYIVFLDRECDVDWETTKEYDEIGHRDDAKFNAVLNRVATIEATPCAGLGAQMKLQFKRLIGEGVARGLAHDYEGAQDILTAAADYILARSQELSRFWYLSASSLMTCPFLAMGGILWVCRDAAVAAVGEGPFWLAMSAAAGAAGALLSVIGRAGRLPFDSSSGKRLHYLEGSSRIWAGSLSGVFVALSVRAGLVLTAFTGGGRMPAIMILGAMVAGTGERLVNSIMADLESARVERTKEEAE